VESFQIFTLAKKPLQTHCNTQGVLQVIDTAEFPIDIVPVSVIPFVHGDGNKTAVKAFYRSLKLPV
jgi:hypothetical protein